METITQDVSAVPKYEQKRLKREARKTYGLTADITLQDGELIIRLEE